MSKTRDNEKIIEVLAQLEAAHKESAIKLLQAGASAETLRCVLHSLCELEAAGRHLGTYLEQNHDAPGAGYDVPSPGYPYGPAPDWVLGLTKQIELVIQRLDANETSKQKD
ncbi:MAG: hypothetical protein AAF528_01215 [Cyanobacteria bacterium P01_C01_bin.121]